MTPSVAFKEVFRTRTTLGSWITLAHPAIAEIMAKAGFDWLVVDLEHSVITIREAEELIRVVELCGEDAAGINGEAICLFPEEGDE